MNCALYYVYKLRYETIGINISYKFHNTPPSYVINVRNIFFHKVRKIDTIKEKDIKKKSFKCRKKKVELTKPIKFNLLPFSVINHEFLPFAHTANIKPTLQHIV